MRVEKWGYSLAIRLPAEVVEVMGIKEGDDIKVEIYDPDTVRVDHEFRKRAIAKLAALGLTLPPDFRFSRDEANER